MKELITTFLAGFISGLLLFTDTIALESADAQNRKFTWRPDLVVIQTEGPNMITQDALALQVHSAIEALRGVNVSPRFERLEIRKRPFGPNTSADYFRLLGHFFGLREWLKTFSTQDKMHYVAEDGIQIGDKLYVGGLSGVCGRPAKGDFMLSQGDSIAFNAQNLPRLTRSSFIVSHELGHMAGAKHDAYFSCWRMDTVVAHCFPENPLFVPKWSNKSRREIANCNRLRWRDANRGSTAQHKKGTIPTVLLDN